MTESAAPVRGTPAKAFETQQVAVGTGPTPLIAARPGRRGVLIVNHGTVDIYLGGPSVDDTTGILLVGIKGSAILIPTDVAIYGVAASGVTVGVAELYGI